MGKEEKEPQSQPEPEKEKKAVVEEDAVDENSDEVATEKIACEETGNADIDSPTTGGGNGLADIEDNIETVPSKTSLLAHQVKSFDSFGGDSASDFTGDVSQRRSS